MRGGDGVGCGGVGGWDMKCVIFISVPSTFHDLGWLYSLIVALSRYPLFHIFHEYINDYEHGSTMRKSVFRVCEQ